MKLLRYGPIGQEKPAALDAEGIIRDLSSIVTDIAGATLSRSFLEKLTKPIFLPSRPYHLMCGSVPASVLSAILWRLASITSTMRWKRIRPFPKSRCFSTNTPPAFPARMIRSAF